jgi:hypothetical protein
MTNEEKELIMNPDEMVEYIRANVQPTDILEISYNRIFAPGEVLTIIEEDEETGEGLRVGLQLNGEILNQNIEVDLNEIKDEILELRHVRDGNVVVIEAEMPEVNYNFEYVK